jgi:hypothetical protein
MHLHSRQLAWSALTWGLAARVAEKVVFPGLLRPASRRVYPVRAAAQEVEHLPAVSSQLVLDPDRKGPAPLLQYLVGDNVLVLLDDGEVPGVVPGLEVVEQLVAQQVAPRAVAGQPVLLPGQAAPLLIGGFYLCLRGYPPDAVSPVIWSVPAFLDTGLGCQLAKFPIS